MYELSRVNQKSQRTESYTGAIGSNIGRSQKKSQKPTYNRIEKKTIYLLFLCPILLLIFVPAMIKNKRLGKLMETQEQRNKFWKHRNNISKLCPIRCSQLFNVGIFGIVFFSIVWVLNIWFLLLMLKV